MGFFSKRFKKALFGKYMGVRVWLQIELKDIESILNQMLGKERDMLFLEEIIGHVKYAVLKQLKFITKNMLKYG